MVKRPSPFPKSVQRGSRNRSPFDYTPPKEPKPRDRNNEALICDAIRRKVMLAFTYRPTDQVERHVAPHVLWITDAEGACVFVLQKRSETGAAESSPQHFDPYKMRGLRVVEETWRVDPSFKRGSYSNVICIVAP